MFNNKKNKELHDVYKLFSRSENALKTIAEIMNPYIKGRGDAIYNNKDVSKDPKSK